MWNFLRVRKEGGGGGKHEHDQILSLSFELLLNLELQLDPCVHVVIIFRDNKYVKISKFYEDTTKHFFNVKRPFSSLFCKIYF